MQATKTARVASRTLSTLQPGKTSTTDTPRHFLSIKDLTPTELKTLINNATTHKKALQSQTAASAHQSWPLSTSLSGRTIPLLFSKRSTRTRISTEGAIVAMGGHPMFLGKEDIQLGVNESLYDTSVVISSMTAGIVARVNTHQDIAELAANSSVPVMNGLCDTFHPMQIIADFACLSQRLECEAGDLAGMKIAWVGDANNVLFDMCIGAGKLGVEMAVATPSGYQIPEHIKAMVQETAGTKLRETSVPEEAVRDADVIVTDTWISMGQEAESQKRLRAFEGYQITEKMAERGGAKKDWKFMHCLPRHKEEVDDEVFYGPRSLVFPEAQNRLWSAIATLEAFVVNKGVIKKTDA
ncbi:ornithine carbamoyltransferase [Knufia fluminis]|uniref:Ornithine carbamoyltransferase, mitochondrial n=1 Tax=Knufia fluminis TaxID=191047 RepID=A0AAN8FD39_9EURO|nr:ornithine carbamoyltransferase [Knufia fluminis]